MTFTSNDVANQALALIGDNLPPVQGFAPTFDSSAAGQLIASNTDATARVSYRDRDRH